MSNWDIDWDNLPVPQEPDNPGPYYTRKIQPGDTVQLKRDYTPWRWQTKPPSERYEDTPENRGINNALGISDENFNDRRDWSPIPAGTMGLVGKTAPSEGAMVRFHHPEYGQMDEWIDNRALQPQWAENTLPAMSPAEERYYTSSWGDVPNRLTDLVQRVHDSGGFSVDKDLNEAPASGYYASQYGGQEIPAAHFSPGHIMDAAKDAAQHYIGAWLENGIVYLDKSFRFDDLQEALNFGAQHQQQAIYDANTGNVIPVPGMERTSKVHEAMPWADQADPTSWQDEPGIRDKRKQRDWTELQPKDEYTNEDWSDPHEVLRQHLQSLADTHGINLKYWGTDPNYNKTEIMYHPIHNEIGNRKVQAAKHTSANGGTAFKYVVQNMGGTVVPGGGIDGVPAFTLSDGTTVELRMQSQRDPYSSNPNPTMFLVWIDVNPRGTGVGTQVMNLLKQYSDQTGLKLQVHMPADAAHPFYQKFDWLEHPSHYNFNYDPSKAPQSPPNATGGLPGTTASDWHEAGLESITERQSDWHESTHDNTDYVKLAGFDVPWGYDAVRPEYGEIPPRMYHVAPMWERENILANGLDATGQTHNTSESGWKDGWEGEPEESEWRPEGVYAFDDHASATEYARAKGQHDIWEINTQHPSMAGIDPIRDPSIAHNWGADDYMGHVFQHVPAQAVRRVEPGEHLATHDKTSAQQVMYHVAPTSARQAIQQGGLNPGAYLFREESQADEWHEDQGAQDTPSDIWQVNADGLQLEETPHRDGMAPTFLRNPLRRIG